MVVDQDRRETWLVERAGVVFGHREKAARWLSRPSRALDGFAPLDLIATESGAKRVETPLGQIEHGIAA